MKTKLLAIGTLGLLSVLSMGRSFNNVSAAVVTDPSGWNWKWSYDSTSTRMEVTHSTLGASGVAWPFTGALGNYDAEIAVGSDISGIDFPVTLQWQFDNSTTAWTVVAGDNYPSSGVSLVGTTTGTGATSNPVKVIIRNDTTSFYQLYLNLSDASSASSSLFNVQYLRSSPYIGDVVGSTSTTVASFSRSSTEYNDFFIPPYTVAIIQGVNFVTSSVYLRDWWLTEYPASSIVFDYDAVYDAGYDAGYIVGIDAAESNVTSRIGQLMGVVFDGLSGILNVKIFDDLTIGTIMLFPLATTMIYFIFKLIRGAKG